MIAIESSGPPDGRRIVYVSRPGSGPVRFACPACGLELDLLQPEPQAPEWLLGMCDGCQLWYLILDDRGDSEAAMMRLPGREVFRDGGGGIP